MLSAVPVPLHREKLYMNVAPAFVGQKNHRSSSVGGLTVIGHGNSAVSAVNAPPAKRIEAKARHMTATGDFV